MGTRGSVGVVWARVGRWVLYYACVPTKIEIGECVCLCVSYHCSNVQPVDFQKVIGQNVNNQVAGGDGHAPPLQHSDVGQDDRSTQIQDCGHKMIPCILQVGVGWGVWGE